MSRLLIANLDCEVAYAGSAGRSLPAHVLEHIAVAAAEMRLLGEPGDRLWLPHPAPAPGFEVVTGPLAELAPADAVLAWGETEEVAALRGGAAPSAEESVAPPSRVTRKPFDEESRTLLWELVTTPAAARASNDKRLAFSVAEELGVALPGSTLVASVEELCSAIANLGDWPAWVAKAPFSAAGRERMRRRGTELDEESRVRAERLLRRFGSLIVEPWVERTRDISACGILAEDELILFPVHRQLVDKAGVCRGIEVDGSDVHPHPQAIEHAASAIAARGYRGPFAIDGYQYRTLTGDLAWQPISEVNARLSFGVLAHAAAARAGGSARIAL